MADMTFYSGHWPRPVDLPVIVDGEVRSEPVLLLDELSDQLYDENGWKLEDNEKERRL